MRETIRLQAGGERSSREREDPRVPRSRSSDPNSHPRRRTLSLDQLVPGPVGQLRVADAVEQREVACERERDRAAHVRARAGVAWRTGIADGALGGFMMATRLDCKKLQ